MDFLAATAITAAGAAAGAINAVVGSGTLITFPTLLALGYPPVLANVSNNIGLVPGVLGGVWGYRRELRGQARRLAHLATASALGGCAGALLLLRLPTRTFQAAVPGSSERDLLLTYELYAFAARDARLRAVMSNWLQASRDALARHFDPLTARALDALVEGFALHNHFDPAPTSRADVAAIVRTVAERHNGTWPRQ